MKRRRLLGAALGGAALGPWSVQAGTASRPAVEAAPGELPAVLRRPAQVSPLAPQAALLAATRVGRRVLLAGERGIVLASDDGGERWSQARVPVQVSLTALAFADEREGWACGHFGSLLHTTDAGAGWRLVMDGRRAAQQLLDDATDDAQRQAARRKLDEGADKPFFDLALVDGRVLAVGAYGLALEGRSGRFRALTPRLPNPRQLHLYGIRAAGRRVVVVGEQGLLLRSSDGGESFEALPSPYKGSFFGVLLPAEGVVLVYGLRGNIWRSADHGNTWSQVPNPVPIGIGAGVQRADGSLVLVAQNGDLLVSRDLGQSFQRTPAAPPLPVAALAELPDGRLLVAGLRGLRRQTA